jgi:hypothetical protein
MSGFNPGDIIVAELKVGIYDFTKSFLTFDIYESIYTPGIVANITILDVGDYLGDQKLSGGEPVNISFQPPGGKMAEYKFVVNKVKNASSPPGQHAKSYVVEAVSEEVMNAKDKYVTKVYDNKMFSEMVQDVFKEFIKSKKKLEVEETKGMQKYNVPLQKPYHAIDMIRRRSISPDNKSSSYIFFENQDGFHFTTIEKLFKDKKIVKTLVQDAATGRDFFSSKGGNIIALKAPQQMDVAKSTSSGSIKSEFNTFNMFTLDYKKKKKDKPENDTSKGAGIDARLKNDYISKHQDEPGYVAVLPVSNERRVGLGGKSNVPERTPEQVAYADALASSVMKLSVFGDTAFKAGHMVTANIQKKTDTTKPQSADFNLSGDFLISAVRHMCQAPATRPRYICALECIKGKYEEDVNT